MDRTKNREIPGIYRVYDDLYSEKYQNYIEKTLYDSENWRFRPSLVDKNIPGEWADASGFANVAFNEDGMRNRDLWSTLHPIATIACEKLDYRIIQLSYCRSFLTFPTVGGGITTPHVDMEDEHHLVCLYYVNDSDGDTILFDKMLGEGNDLQNTPIFARIKPKKGRVLVFCGRQYHAASLPEHNIRTIINFNIIGKYNGLN